MPLGVTLTSTTLHVGGSLVIDRATNKVYLIADAQKHWVASAEIFASNNFSWSQVKTATTEDLQLTSGADVGFAEGTIVRPNNSPYVYVINKIDGTSNYEKRHVVDQRTYLGLGYNSTNTYIINPSLLPSQSGADISEN